MSEANAYERIRNLLEKKQPVLLDGPMGTELFRRGVRWRKHGLQTDAPAVQKLHGEYIEAGADVIRTNTFQLNPRIYRNVFRDLAHMRHIGAPGLEDLPPQLLRTAAELARAARAAAKVDGRVAVAGVLSPLEHCFRPDLAPAEDVARREHEAQARIFAEANVDLLLLESMNTLRETRAALAAARATGLPVWVSFVLGPEGELLSGEPLADAIKAAAEGGAAAVLVNCSPPEDITRAIARLAKAASLPCGGFAHIGRFSPPSWKFEFFPQLIDTESWPADRYLGEAQRWCASGATIVGACCGARPEHIAALRGWLGKNGKGAGQ